MSSPEDRNLSDEGPNDDNSNDNSPDDDCNNDGGGDVEAHRYKPSPPTFWALSLQETGLMAGFWAGPGPQTTNPDDQRAGSPFDTGYKNVFSPQFKRIAALQGDFVFHGPRRLLLQNVAGRQKSWGFIHKRGKDLPYAHSTDLVNSFGMLDDAAPSELRDNIIWFTNSLDPNGETGTGSEVTWPQWDPRDPKALVFRDGLLPLVIADDNYRTDALMFMRNISLLNPI
ncbi:hypothetical protein EDB87DRAFT_1686390 [Lactarius vividus]|nr:hypothetical protein EDB87DRAFT_1686390 [Lactarius vividus]